MRSPELGVDYVRRAKARLAPSMRCLRSGVGRMSCASRRRLWNSHSRVCCESLASSRRGSTTSRRSWSRSKSRLPRAFQEHVDSLAAGSRMLRRDRELAFYGAEDLTPSGFYTREDAVAARDIARTTVAAVEPHIKE